jgi:hypothetical protein
MKGEIWQAGWDKYGGALEINADFPSGFLHS